MENDAADSDSESESEEEGSELTHTVQQELLLSRRRRIIKDSSGQQIISCIQLSGQRQSTSVNKAGSIPQL